MEADQKMEPLLFNAIPMERIWGGRQLETHFGKTLPPGKSIGESWEIVDRPEAQSIVRQGCFQGRTLHDLWTNDRERIFGPSYSKIATPRFPILIKLIDARHTLSLQVHPPPEIALSLNGEPKTEMWYFLETEPNAFVYAGLKRGVTHQQFKQHLDAGHLEPTLHKIFTHRGQSFFIPSGRLHAIGAGNIIVEIQQNSDTTYRIFDWNRTLPNGSSRQLHIKESLASINFNDYEPHSDEIQQGPLAQCSYFQVEKQSLTQLKKKSLNGQFAIICVVTGKASIAGQLLNPAEFCLLPAALNEVTLVPIQSSTELIIITL